MPTGRTRGTALLAVALLGLASAVPVDGATSGRGGGSARIQPFVELQTTDGTIATLSTTPTSDSPGPIVYDLDDSVTFNGRWTNTRHVVLLDVPTATDGSAADTKTIQGTAHAIADWIHIRQDTGNVFGQVQGIGSYDSDVAAYTAPSDFTTDSQGTLTLRSYPTSSPMNGATLTTIHWIYDAGADVYWFDVTDKDFTNGNGETRVYPISHLVRMQYTFSLGDLTYAVASVGGAGAGYLPTMRLGWFAVPSAAGGHDFECTVLFDFPAGTPTDEYDFTIQATVHSLK